MEEGGTYTVNDKCIKGVDEGGHALGMVNLEACVEKGGVYTVNGECCKGEDEGGHALGMWGN
jgi:hypothetical protein